MGKDLVNRVKISRWVTDMAAAAVAVEEAEEAEIKEAAETADGSIFNQVLGISRHPAQSLLVNVVVVVEECDIGPGLGLDYSLAFSRL